MADMAQLEKRASAAFEKFLGHTHFRLVLDKAAPVGSVYRFHGLDETALFPYAIYVDPEKEKVTVSASYQF